MSESIHIDVIAAFPSQEMERELEHLRKAVVQRQSDMATMQEQIVNLVKERNALRAENEALRKGPSVEELAVALYATLTLGDDAQAWIITQAQARAVLRALGRYAG